MHHQGKMATAQGHQPRRSDNLYIDNIDIEDKNHDDDHEDDNYDILRGNYDDDDDDDEGSDDDDEDQKTGGDDALKY